LEKVRAQILEETKLGRLVPVNHTPFRLNAIGAIPKAGSEEIRRITDTSRPIGSAVNELQKDMPFSLESIDVFLTKIKKGYYIALVDLRTAYRFIHIFIEDWDVQSFEFEGIFYQDRFMGFGLKIAPATFSMLTTAIRDRLEKLLGIPIGVYLDELAPAGPSYKIVMEALILLVTMVESLGFQVNWKKLQKPSKIVKYLGLIINTDTMTVSIPQDKMQEIKAEILEALKLESLSLKHIERLVGRLNFYSRAVRGSRTFMRRMLDYLKFRKRTGQVAPAPLLKGLRNDLIWWDKMIEICNGTAHIPQDLAAHWATDASLIACGAVFHKEAFVLKWTHPMTSYHINILELLTVLFSLRRWANQMSNSIVKLLVDNSVTMSWINRGKTKKSEKPKDFQEWEDSAMDILREICFLCIKYNVAVTAQYIPSAENVIPDAISRLEFSKIPQSLQLTHLTAPPASLGSWQ